VKGGFRPEVTSAFNGDDALRIYREHGPFDLVLSDLLPMAGLVLDGVGNLHGTSLYGGTGTGCGFGA
jgi:hypothetical protein